MQGLDAAANHTAIGGMKRYKIAAQKAGDEFLGGHIYAEGKETFVSLDRHSPYANYHKAQKNARLIWCKSKYPTYPDDIRKAMPDFGGDWFGYSDHMHGIDACLLAVARGAQYIEKHFCLDKTDLTVRDTVFSATPDEFSEMVRIGNGIARLLHAGV
jgi:N,N'-diacetyllegionaminate synthase